MIVFKMLTKAPHKGAFVVGDTESRVTSYAYPSSVHATAAARKPEVIAQTMISQEKQWSRNSPSIPAYDARNWELLA